MTEGRGARCPSVAVKENENHCTSPSHADKGIAPPLDRHLCGVRFHLFLPRADQPQWVIIVSDRVHEHEQPTLRALVVDTPRVVREAFAADDRVRPLDVIRRIIGLTGLAAQKHVQTQLRDVRALASPFEPDLQAAAALLEVTSVRLVALENFEEDTNDGYLRSMRLPTGDDEADRIGFVQMMAHAILLAEAASDGRFGVYGTF